MQTERSRRSPRLVLTVMCLAASGAASAEDFYSAFRTPHADWSVFAGANRTDNATLEPNGPSDTIATAGFSGSLYRDTGNLKADLDGVLYYEDYLGGTFDSHVLGNFRGVASYAFVPERFSWVVQDSFGQVNANQLLPTTPANRVSGNVVSTGPDGFLRFGGDLGLALGARYAQSNYQSNPNAQVDDQRVSGIIGLVKRVSAATAMSLNATAARTEYRVPGHPSYDQAEFFGRYESTTVRSGMTLDLGVGELRDSVTSSVVHDPIMRLTLFHRLTPSWNVNLSAGQEFQNTSTALQSALNTTRVVNGQTAPGATGSSPPGAGGAADNVVLSQSPYRSEYLTVAFDFVRPRTTFDLHGQVERQRYQFGASGLDRDLRGGGARFTRLLRRSLSFRAAADYERRAPSEGLPGDQTKLADAGFEWQAGALLAVALSYHREQRSTDAGGFGYTENLIYLGLRYGAPRRSISFQPPGHGVSGTSALPP